MYKDSNFRSQVLSSLLGQTVTLDNKKVGATTASTLSVEDFHLYNLIGRRQDNVTKRFIDVKNFFGPKFDGGFPHLLLSSDGTKIFINEKEFFDPGYDYDFTDLSDLAECKRGDEPYKRPKGWYRMALKVEEKYPDGDTWLGTGGWRSYSVPGEWPVSYHGTSLDGAEGIIGGHYEAGSRALYGRGIYSTPDIEVAERFYATSFVWKTTGKSYKVILQNRINPKKREICKGQSDYWLIRVDAGTSASVEKQIVESSIRPYGILIKEV